MMQGATEPISLEGREPRASLPVRNGRGWLLRGECALGSCRNEGIWFVGFLFHDFSSCGPRLRCGGGLYDAAYSYCHIHSNGLICIFFLLPHFSRQDSADGRRHVHHVILIAIAIHFRYLPADLGTARRESPRHEVSHNGSEFHRHIFVAINVGLVVVENPVIMNASDGRRKLHGLVAKLLRFRLSAKNGGFPTEECFCF
jgi:hypothetical protein